MSDGVKVRLGVSVGVKVAVAVSVAVGEGVSVAVGVGVREGIERVEVAQIAERRIAVGQARVGGCVPCVHLNCFVELVDCFEQAGFAALVPKRAPAKVALISRGIHHIRRGQTLLFVRRESDSNLFSNVVRNFTLR